MTTSGCAVKKDVWVGQMLGRDAFTLTLGDRLSATDIDDALEDLPTKNNVFVCTKVCTNNVEALKTLCARGFYLVDTNITFRKTVLAPEKFSKINIVEAKDTHRESIGHIASTSLTKSRFHLDPAISNDTASRLKRAWVDNYFNGARGDALLVALIDGQVAGFNLLLIEKERGTVTIDLIAVGEDFQRRGVGAALVSAAEKTNAETCQKIVVGTQIANQLSHSFYQKLGFQFFDAKYVLHYHLKKEA
jgi:ribosomal protein S18 acetylase RimI-like enzyme